MAAKDEPRASETIPADSPSAQALVDAAFERLDADQRASLVRTIAADPRLSVRPPASGLDTADRMRLATLTADAAERDVAASIDLGETLGEGGMGLVRLGKQRSLGREVAVKTLRPEARTPEGVARMIREAWVTGSLEHPNVVPVYDLGLDPDGAPVIVLKRIRGEAWSRVARETDLEGNLRIFLQMCNAVALAHARGVLHLDLKPENVMIGSFGEVYLVDWGIAASSRDDVPLPSAASRRDPIGTPAYMAPEMLDPTIPLTERTDVYLLGAILFELLAGSPPHDVGNFHKVLLSILRSEPVFPPSAPPELALVAARAMRKAPADRFASVGELRLEVEWFLRHRGSIVLSDEASRRLVELTDLAGTTEGLAAPASREKVYRLFGEARFGFRQALLASDDNAAAKDGLARTIALVAEWELAHGTPRAAAAALAELADPPATLAERVASAVREEEQRAARLAGLEREIDPATGRRTRALAGVLMGVVWSFFPVGLYLLDQPGAGTWARRPWALTILLSLLTVAVTWWARPVLIGTVVNRRALLALRVSLVGQLALELATGALGLPARTSMVLHFVVWFTTSSAYAALVDPKTWPGALCFLVGLLAGAMWPEHIWAISAFGVAGLIVSGAPGLRARARPASRPSSRSPT